MPRIRTIKPQLWQDAKIGRCTLPARLVFIGCVSMADDHGKLRADPASIRADLFRFDDVSLTDVGAWLLELHEARLIDLYESHDGQRYARIPNWSKHQRLNRVQPSELPDPGGRCRLVERAGEQEIHHTRITDASHVHDTSAPGERSGGGEGGDISDSLRSSSSSAGTDLTLLEPPPAKKPPKPVDPTVVACFEWYCELWGKSGAFALDLTKKRQKAIEAALKAHGKAKVIAVIRGHHANPWRHDNGLAVNDIAVLLREDNIDVGVEWAAKAAGVPQPGAVLPQNAFDGMGYE